MCQLYVTHASELTENGDCTFVRRGDKFRKREGSKSHLCTALAVVSLFVTSGYVRCHFLLGHIRPALRSSLKRRCRGTFLAVLFLLVLLTCVFTAVVRGSDMLG